MINDLVERLETEAAEQKLAPSEYPYLHPDSFFVHDARVRGLLLEAASALRAKARDPEHDDWLEPGDAEGLVLHVESWINRAARIAAELLQWPLGDVAAIEHGNGIQHIAWMAMKLAAKDVGSETKTCRWLGYVQGALVTLGYSTLEAEKRRNLRSSKEGA